MQQNTKKKINEIQQMINDGIEEKEIIKLKFKSSPKFYKEWIEKFGSYLKIKSEEIAVQQIELNNIPFVPTNYEIEKLKNLLENAEDLLALLNKEKTYDMHNINILSVPEELLKLNDVKLATIRISEKIEKDFNKLVAKNKLYSKTSLINLALLEFIEKYK